MFEHDCIDDPRRFASQSEAAGALKMLRLTLYEIVKEQKILDLSSRH